MIPITSIDKDVEDDFGTIESNFYDEFLDNIQNDMCIKCDKDKLWCNIIK